MSIKIVCENRGAFHHYHIEEKIEAGIVLKGTEVKSLRDGKANLKDAYAVFKGNEIYLLNSHINAYSHGNVHNHEPERSRKLLLHREEISKLWSQLEKKGYSLIPTKLYFKEGKAKLELGLGKGKKLFDKRATIKDREQKRAAERAMRHRR